MKYALPFLLCSAALFSFYACRSTKPPEESSELPVETSAETSELPAEHETTIETSAPLPESSTAETDFTTDRSDITLFPVPDNPMPDYQGGEGGEDFAETPLPEYFTYRIYENGFSARLAGGNYQSVQLSADCPPLLSGAEQDYSLFDSDFDGAYDLAIRIKSDYGQHAYAVFLWNSESMKFDESPVLLYNPRFDKDNQTVISLQQADDKNAYLAIYLGSPKTPLLWCHADYSTLTLYGPALYEQSNLPQTKYDSEDALTDALMEIYQHYIPPEIPNGSESVLH